MINCIIISLDLCDRILGSTRLALTSRHDGTLCGSRLQVGVRARLTRNAAILPLIVCALLVSGSIYGWVIISDQQREQLISNTHEHVDHISSRLEAHISSRLILGERIHQEWLKSTSTDSASFKAIVAPKLYRFLDIQAINWIGLDGTIKWFNSFQGNEAALGVNVKSKEANKKGFDTAAASGTLTVSPPFDLVQGGKGFVAYVPFAAEGREPGAIEMVFRTDPLINYALPYDPEHSVSLKILDGDITVFERHEAPADVSFLEIQTIEIAARDWVVKGAPTVKGYAESLSPSDEIFLGVGLLIAIVLPLLLRLLMMRHIALHDSERRLSDFADVSSDWFWETDNQLRFSYFSRRFEDVTSVAPEVLMGKTRREVGAPGADPEAYNAMLANMDSHLPFQNFEHHREKSNGEIVYLSISGVPVFEDDGTFIGYRGIGRDITEQFINQQALNEALAASERANWAKTEFLATMSHEFRTPLNAILGFSEMLRAQYFGPIGAKNYEEYASDIHTSGQYLLGLVNDILDISAIEASKRTMLKEEMSVLDMTNRAVKSVQQKAWTAGLRITIDIPNDLPRLVADQRSVLQILMNILSNAVKFSKPDGKISISASSSNEAISIVIADTGLGIDAETLPSVTEPFAQSQSNRHLAEVGTGLGLSIVKSLMDAHGGSLQIESTIDIGTTVTLVFIR